MCGNDKHSSLVLSLPDNFQLTEISGPNPIIFCGQSLDKLIGITRGSLIMLNIPATAINLWLVLQVFKVPIKKLHSCNRTVIFTVSLLENGNKTKNLHFL